MKKPRLLQSLYARTILMLSVSILVVFVILGVVYYSIVNVTSQRQQAEQLLGSAQAVAEVVSGSYDPLKGEITDGSVRSYVNFAARSTGSVVWVVSSYGEIVMQTGVPTEAARQMRKTDKGYYRLDTKYLGTVSGGQSGITETGDYKGLLKGNSKWLSAVWPIPSSTGAFAGEIQIHQVMSVRTFNNFLMTNGLLVSFVIAFAIALVFVWILSKNITRPIRRLSEAADRVYRGDLSARVILPGQAGKSAVADGQRDPLFNDDLTILVNTMNTMIEKLENQERDRKDFMSSVSHDLRTPITSIKGFIEGMIDGTVPADKYPYYLDIVKQEVLRLQGLVQTIFEAALLESGSGLHQSVFDLNELIKEDVIGLESLLMEKHLGVQTDFLEEQQGRLMVTGDREAISRVVYNIVSNAIKFTPEDGVIALTTRRTSRSREVEVIIEDSGPGIPELDLPYIFDRFYKADKSRNVKGSGLGLYISRTILTAHGQRILVSRSELGGAKFSFTLSTP
ncbi:MAG: HAMP domain-containing histidine kinase [Clostridiaceae bacterium]|nr:HAMP domain-containing histidine kinase [Clostridiaceae bacterium]